MSYCSGTQQFIMLFGPAGFYPAELYENGMFVVSVNQTTNHQLLGASLVTFPAGRYLPLAKSTNYMVKFVFVIYATSYMLALFHTFTKCIICTAFKAAVLALQRAHSQQALDAL